MGAGPTRSLTSRHNQTISSSTQHTHGSVLSSDIVYSFRKTGLEKQLKLLIELLICKISWWLIPNILKKLWNNWCGADEIGNNCNCCSKYYVSDIVENVAFSSTDYEQQCEVFCSHLKVMHHFDKFHENKQQSRKKRGGINPANMFSHLYFLS